MLSNMIGTIEFLSERTGSDQGFLAKFYAEMLRHAKANERLYTNHARNCWYFYYMILNYVATRGVEFMESCAFDYVSKLAIRKMNTETLK